MTLPRIVTVVLAVMLLGVPVVSAQRQLLPAPTGFSVDFVTGGDKADRWVVQWNTVAGETKWNLKFHNASEFGDSWGRIKGSKQNLPENEDHGKIWYWEENGKSYVSFRGFLTGYSNISIRFKLFVRTSDNNKRSAFVEYQYTPPAE